MGHHLKIREEGYPSSLIDWRLVWLIRLGSDMNEPLQDILA